jgi:type VI secretion system secreted protein Hcp
MPIYMKYEGIEGPLTGKYKGWIDLTSCQIGTHRSTSKPDGSGGSPPTSEVTVTKEQDTSSRQLLIESLDGKPKKVLIDFFASNEAAPYLSLELQNTVIASYAVSGSGANKAGGPLERLSLNYSKIAYTPKATSASKNSADTAAWNMATSSP